MYENTNLIDDPLAGTGLCASARTQRIQLIKEHHTRSRVACALEHQPDRLLALPYVLSGTCICVDLSLSYMVYMYVSRAVLTMNVHGA